jgi:integrase/recombinase XerD
MIDSVFLIQSIREKHRKAPCLSERERYLTYLIEIGACRERVRIIATMLLNVVQLLKLDSLRPVGMDEIAEGYKGWVDDSGACQRRKFSMASSKRFKVAARSWLRFQGFLLPTPKPVPPFGNLLPDFLNAMHSQHLLSFGTLRSYRTQILAFLNWLQSHCPQFSNVLASNIDEYIEAKRSDGWSLSSVATLCVALRSFFGYAEEQRWCSSGIRASISIPRVPRIAAHLSSLPWEDVRRVIGSIGDLEPHDLRAKAMFLLFSIYGFRAVEVEGLTLEDIDWRRETITVRRAKRGKTQQFPLQSEVGEAIALYLEKVRPRCHCRNLFVTLQRPYRQVLGRTMSAIISPRIKKLGFVTEQYGPHMLRRACATQLLRTGSSIKEIADFLGHSNLRTVSSYAKFDLASLRNVAHVSLRGVL